MRNWGYLAVEAVAYCTIIVEGPVLSPFPDVGPTGQGSLFPAGLLGRCLHRAWRCSELQDDVREGDPLVMQAEFVGLLSRLRCKFTQKSHL